MTEPDARVEIESMTPLNAPLAAFVGWVPVAIVDLIMMTVRRSGPAPVYRIAEAYALQFGNAIAAGMLSAIMTMAFITVRQSVLKTKRPRLKRIIDIGAVLVATAFLSSAFLKHDFDSVAMRKGDDLHVRYWMIQAACLALLTVGLTVGYGLARWLGKSWWRMIPCSVALVIIVANYFFLLADYYNLHFSGAWLAANLIGASLVGLPLPNRWRRPTTAALSAMMVMAAAALVVPAPPGVVARMLATRADPFTLLLVARGYHGHEGKAVIPAEQAEWFAPRTDTPPIPSTTDVERAEKTIVLMLTVDCFRGDFYADEKEAKYFPHLVAMKEDGVYFKNAHSPGAQTIYTMTSWFTGKYFSEQIWRARKRGELLTWPWDDPTLRFPTLMDESGISSMYVMAGNWLGPPNGMVRGFSSVIDLQRGEKYNDYARASRVAQVVIDRLENDSDGPLYVFAHFMDAHMPYKGVKPGGGTRAMHLKEIAVVDREIDRIVRRVGELGLKDRTTIIISADHGEAFGDHGLTQHGVSLFEELVHVPLLIIGPNFPPRVVETQVSTIDLGPTILDMFAMPTPGWMMGQSLVGVLEGGEPHFTRPIVAENRLRQMMLFPDGVKVSRDLHFGDGDAFDLESDPLELKNRIDDPAFDTKNRFALLKAFFNAHTVKFKNYKPPFRR
jgi:hypothetical protein